MDKVVVEKLKDLRKENNITQERLSELLDISRSKVSSWETNKRDMSITEAVKLSKIYKTSLDNLFGIEDINEKQYLEISNKFIKNKEIPLGEKIKIIEFIKDNLKKTNIDELYENYKMTQNATK